MADEKKLLFRIKNKEQNSINDAIEIYTPYLSTVLFNMVGNKLPKEDIEEIVSDVFITLWKNAEYIDLKKGSMRGYMATVARNFALKRLNKKNDCICLDDLELAFEDTSIDKVSDDNYLWKAVMSLGEPDNEIFVRYYKFDEKLTTISKSMGLKLSTVKTKLSRGKHKLKKILKNAEEKL